MDCSLPSSSVHEISQAKMLEWVAISFSRGPFKPRGQTCIFCNAGEFSNAEPPGRPISTHWGPVLLLESTLIKVTLPCGACVVISGGSFRPSPPRLLCWVRPISGFQSSTSFPSPSSKHSNLVPFQIFAPKSLFWGISFSRIDDYRGGYQYNPFTGSSRRRF